MLHLWLVLQLAGEAGVFTGLPRDPRLERLQAWVEAIEQHQPGTADAPAVVLRSWDRAALTEIHEDLPALSELIANPGARIVFYEPANPDERRRRQKPGYTPNQWEGIRRLPYIVVYTVRGDAIYVVRILHGAQQWP